MRNNFVKWIFFLIVTLLIPSWIYAQQQSKQHSFQEECLFHAAKIWGFVKYYHPEARQGKYDMDSLLVVLLDKVANTKDTKQRNAVFTKWIGEFGDITESEAFLVNDSSRYQFYEYSWLVDKSFDKRLSKKLLAVKNAKRDNECYYVTTQSGIGNSIFTNEKQDSLDFSTPINRLLPLIRYWNMVEYFFPYKYLIGKDWNETLKAYIPLFLEQKDTYLLNSKLAELTCELNDGHSGLTNSYKYFKPFYNRYSVPIEVSYVKDKFIVTNILKDKNGEQFDCGLEMGDVIVSVEGERPDSIMLRHSKMLSTSNTNSLNNRYGFLLFKVDTTVINLVCERNGVKLNIKATAPHVNEITPPIMGSVTSVEVLNGNIGYIRPVNIPLHVIDSMMTVIKDTKGVIIDLRCYPMGDFYNFMHRFLTDTVMSPQFSFPNLQYPGTFHIQQSNPVFNSTIKDRYARPIVLLVDYGTFSKPEYMVMYMQRNKNTVTIGSQSGGANGDVSRLPLQGKQYATFSGYGIHNFDGTEMQRVGVRLDETVYPTIDDIKHKVDYPLQRAIEILKNY